MSDQWSTLADSETEPFVFGYREEWESFKERQQDFLQSYPALLDTIEITFLRRVALEAPIDKFVFLYGRLCCEDFHEILLLCGNGYGIAGWKLLRTLYEHAVELAYLSEHPDELLSFYDYGRVAKYKALKSILETCGKGALDPNTVAKAKEEFDEVEDRFMVTACKGCGTKRMNHRWSKLDFVSLASKTMLRDLIVPCYLLPLQHAHATVASLESRLKELDNGSITFVSESQRDDADRALMYAHHVILMVLEIEKKKFSISGLSESLQRCNQDFDRLWNVR